MMWSRSPTCVATTTSQSHLLLSSIPRMTGNTSSPFGTASAPSGGIKSFWQSTMTSAVLPMAKSAFVAARRLYAGRRWCLEMHGIQRQDKIMKATHSGVGRVT